MLDFAQFHLWGSVALLALLLFFPVSRIIWTLSCRRLTRKLKTELSAEQAQGQLTRARFIAIPLVLLFSYLFYINVVRGLYGG